jgi:hypothetical protein
MEIVPYGTNNTFKFLVIPAIFYKLREVWIFWLFAARRVPARWNEPREFYCILVHPGKMQKAL